MTEHDAWMILLGAAALRVTQLLQCIQIGPTWVYSKDPVTGRWTWSRRP